MPEQMRRGITGPKITIYFLALLALAFFDQITKWHVFENMLRIDGENLCFLDWLRASTTMEETLASFAQFRIIEVTSFFDLVAVWNSGVSFGLLQNAGDLMPVLLMVFALIMSVVMIVWGLRSPNRWEQIGTLLIATGALSNAFDRFRFKAVADFLYFNYNGYYWPAFNAADSYIALGAGLLVVYILFMDEDKE